MQGHNVNRRGVRRLVCAAALLALSGASAVVTAQGPAGGPGLGPVLDQAFEVSMSSGQVAVGRRGKERRTFATRKSHRGQNLEVTLSEQGGQAHRFRYDENRHVVRIERGSQQPVTVAIGKERVTVGKASCPLADDQCIAKAVSAALPDLRAEEVVGMLAMVTESLPEMRHGGRIRQVMAVLAEALANPEVRL